MKKENIKDNINTLRDIEKELLENLISISLKDNIINYNPISFKDKFGNLNYTISFKINGEVITIQDFLSEGEYRDLLIDKEIKNSDILFSMYKTISERITIELLEASGAFANMFR